MNLFESLKPYDSYKDSGVEWLGKVPMAWGIRSIGSMSRMRSEKNHPQLPLLSVVREKGIVLRETMSREENHNFVPDDLSGYKVVRKGDLVINKMKAWQGSMGIAPQDGIVSPAYFVLQLAGDHERFLHQLLRSMLYVGAFASASDGVRIGQWDLSIPQMKRIPLLLPPLSEQEAIVRFLDHMDSKIKKFIAAKEQMIKLLEEEKQAIINQAVTRGLDPNVKLKPSGVEWLGNIPEHWEVRRLKTLLTEFSDRTDTGKEELLSLRMREGLVPHSDVSDKPISDDDLVGYKRVKPRQLVMNRMRASIGIFGIPKQNGLVSPDYATFVSTEDVAQEYFLRLFKTPNMMKEFRLESKGLGTGSSGFMRLYTDRFGVIWVPLPPKKEQVEIVKGIEQASMPIHASLSAVKKSIALLKEFSTRLIADVVTGKLDVREAAKHLDESKEEVAA